MAEVSTEPAPVTWGDVYGTLMASVGEAIDLGQRSIATKLGNLAHTLRQSQNLTDAAVNLANTETGRMMRQILQTTGEAAGVIVAAAQRGLSRGKDWMVKAADVLIAGAAEAIPAAASAFGWAVPLAIAGVVVVGGLVMLKR